MSERFDAIEHRLDDMMTKADGDKLWTAMDRLYGTCERLDTEQTAFSAQARRLEDEIRGHEIRIKVLEQV